MLADDGASEQVLWYRELRQGAGIAQALDPGLRAVLLDTTAAIADAQGAATLRAREETAASARSEHQERRAAERARTRRQAVHWGYPVLAFLVVLAVDVAIVKAFAQQANSYVQQDPDNAFIRLIGYCLIPLFMADVPLILILAFVGFIVRDV